MEPGLGLVFAIVLDESLQSTDRRIPIGRDLVERAPCFLEASGLQLIDPLPPPTDIPHQAGCTERPQLLGDRLARDARTVTQPTDRERALDAESRHEPRPR